MKEKKNGIVDLLGLLSKWRNFILINFVLVTIASVVISLNLPLWYKSTAIVIPPSDQSGSSGMAALLGNLPLAGLGIGMGGGSEMTYMAILKSRSLAMDVIEKYDLKSFYEKETYEETIKAFYNDFDAQFTEENMIAITYEYTDSVRVAEIVNYVVGELGKRATGLMLQKARETKGYVEKRYYQNLRDIDSLSKEIESFHSRHGIIEFSEQTKSLIAAVADLEAQIFIKKAELETVEKSVGKNTKLYTDSKYSLEALSDQLHNMKFDKVKHGESPFSSLFVPFNEIPELGRRYAKLQTEYLLQLKLQEYIVPEYEQAKLQIQKDKPAMQVLDYASAPDRKSAPKRAFIVMGALMISLIIVFLFIFFAEHMEYLKKNDPERYFQIRNIRRKWAFMKPLKG